MKPLILAASLAVALSGAALAEQWPIETHSFTNLSATPANFLLSGGAYGVTVHAGTWSSGSVTLARLATDGSTFVSVQAFTADGYANINLPNGTYQLTITSATGVYADVTSVVVNK